MSRSRSRDSGAPARLGPGLAHELELLRAGFARVAGLDEAGRGAWAGPVYAGAVVLPAAPAELDALLGCVDDSKRLSPAGRERAERMIRALCPYTGVGAALPEEIDALGIAAATRLAWRRALAAIPDTDYLLLDAFRLPESPLPQRAIVGGDGVSLSIAAASVLAKVARDRRMRAWGSTHPPYGFERHKGYGTAEHRRALREHGPCALHRWTWAPVRQLALDLAVP